MVFVFAVNSGFTLFVKAKFMHSTRHLQVYAFLQCMAESFKSPHTQWSGFKRLRLKCPCVRYTLQSSQLDRRFFHEKLPTENRRREEKKFTSQHRVRFEPGTFVPVVRRSNHYASPPRAGPQGKSYSILTES